MRGQKTGKITKLPDDSPIRTTMEVMLVQGQSPTLIMRTLKEKYDFDVSDSAIYYYNQNHFHDSDRYYQQLDKLEAITRENVSLQREMAIRSSIDAKERSQQTIQQQIDYSLEELYRQIDQVKRNNILPAALLKDLYRSVREFLEFKNQYLKDQELLKERNWVAQKFVDAFVDLLQRSTFDNEVKKTLIDDYLAHTKLILN